MSMPKSKPDALTQRRPASQFPVKQDYGTGSPLVRDTMVALILWAKGLGLNAWLGHVCYYYGRPYVQLTGRLYHAHKQKTFQGYETRPGTPEERAAHQLEDGDHLWVAIVHDSRFKVPVAESGIVRATESTAMSEKHPDRLRSPVVAANPSLMAEKRALARVLERAYPLGLEILEDVVLEGETGQAQGAQEPLFSGEQ